MGLAGAVGAQRAGRSPAAARSSSGSSASSRTRPGKAPSLMPTTNSTSRSRPTTDSTGPTSTPRPNRLVPGRRRRQLGFEGAAEAAGIGGRIDLVEHAEAGQQVDHLVRAWSSSGGPPRCADAGSDAGSGRPTVPSSRQVVGPRRGAGSSASSTRKSRQLGQVRRAPSAAFASRLSPPRRRRDPACRARRPARPRAVEVVEPAARARVTPARRETRSHRVAGTGPRRRVAQRAARQPRHDLVAAPVVVGQGQRAQQGAARPSWRPAGAPPARWWGCRPGRTTRAAGGGRDRPRRGRRPCARAARRRGGAP